MTRTFGAWGQLLAFWGLWLGVFVHFMLPHFRYITDPGLIGNDAPCGKPECDFSVFWPAGVLARWHDYTTLYSAHQFIPAVNALLIPSQNIETFFYPPPILLPAALVSHLPFELGFFVWTGVQLASAVHLAVAVLVMGGIAWRGGVPVLDKAALTALLSLLATSYGYTDNMAASSAMLAALAERCGWRIGLREVVFWSWPALCPTVSVASGVLFTPLAVVLAAVGVWQGAALRARAAVLPPRPTGA